MMMTPDYSIATAGCPPCSWSHIQTSLTAAQATQLSHVSSYYWAQCFVVL